MNLHELLESRSGESLETYGRGINPQFVKILRTIGFDRRWQRTSGAYLFDTDGERYLDLLGGFGMFNVGRNNPRVRQAIVDAMELEVPNAIQLGVSPLPGLLAEALLARAPAGLGKVLFTSSGTEATLLALRLAQIRLLLIAYPQRRCADVVETARGDVSPLQPTDAVARSEIQLSLRQRQLAHVQRDIVN